jgi:phosphatidylcholine synthase
MTSGRKAPPIRRAAGLSVHLFTASGAAVALLALAAAIERNFPLCFAWLGLALFIDGVDGTLARFVRVKETAPTIDGATLDLVVDFLTYVVTPMVALWRSNLMPAPIALALSAVVVIASALYFAGTRMKTPDHWFRGFPALWNAFAFYLFVFKPPWPLSAALTLLGAAAMFAPVVFIHPLRVKRLRPLTLAATIAWFAFAGIAIFQGLEPALWVKIGLAAIVLYLVGLPLARGSPWAES